MSIPAGMLRHRVLIIPEGAKHRSIDFSNIQAPAQVRKAFISKQTEDLDRVPGFGISSSGMIKATLRKDSFTVNIDKNYHIVFDDVRYRVTEAAPRYDKYDNLIDLTMEIN